MNVLQQARQAALVVQEQVVFVHTIGNLFRPQDRMDARAAWRPGLTPADLLPAGWDRETCRLALNGQPLEAGWGAPIARGDHVLIVRAPAAAGAVGMLIQAVATYLVNKVLIFDPLFNLLIPQLPGREVGKDSNPVYGWSAIGTNYNPRGMPRPIQYGEHRQGGAVIGQWVDVVDGDPPQSFLNLLLLVSSGPILSIGQYTTDQDGLVGDALPHGLKIDDNPATNYDGITASVRMGSLTQDAIPGAADTRIQYDVDLPIEQEPPGSTPIIDWTEAAGFDMPGGTTADRCRIGLFWPEGLYELSGDGDLVNERVDLQVRYVELDGSGNPTGPYANVFFGDDTTLSVKAHQTNPFHKQLDVAFYDPTTFTPPELSDALQFSRTNKHYGTLDGTPPLEPGWAANGVVQELSAVGVIRVRTSHLDNPWFGRMSGLKGFEIRLRETSPGVSHVAVLWGTGTVLSSVADMGTVESDTWVMLAFTYKKGVGGGGLNRLRVAIDGQIVHEELSATNIVMPSTGFRWNVIPGQEAGTSANFGEIDHDEFRLYNVELSPDQLAALHNSGDWQSGKATDLGLVAAFHMDQVIGTAPKTTPSYLPSQPPMVLQATSGAQSLIEGAVTNVFDNAVKRSRYRVQVQRTNVAPTGLGKKTDVRFDHFIAITDEEVAYGGDALLFLRLLASDQLSGAAPNVTLMTKGRRTCPVWDGVNPDSPTFSQQYSINPAWILADLLLDSENGGGNFFGVHDIDWPRLKEWADICDEKVYDQRGQFTAGQLDYAASGLGFDGAVYKVQLPMPRPLHLVVGKTVRVRDVAAGGSDYPEGVFEIGQVVDIDDDAYELWLAWPDGLAAPASNPFIDSAAAVLEGVEGRHECHLLLLDRDLKFWDAVHQICGVGRASPMRVGDKLRVKYEGPRDPVALFTAANIVAGSFRISAGRREENTNSLVGEIQDRDLEYERNPVPRDHPSVQAATSTTVIRRRIVDLRGITSRSQAIRELDFRLAVDHEVRLGCEFDCGMDAAFVEPGDVIAVAHPMPAWAHGGRALEDSPDASGLRVDVPVVVGAKNLLGSTDELADLAYWARTGANPPTLFSAVEPDPAGVAQAAVFDFGADSVLRYSRPLRAGSYLAGSVYAKVKDGLGAVSLNLNVDNGGTSLSVPDDGAWHRIEAPLQAAAADQFDVEVVSRRVALAWAQLERGQAATAYERVGVPSAATLSVAVQDGDHDVLSFAAVPADAWGAYEAAELVPLAAPLASTPRKGWLWALGPEDHATVLFQVVDTSMRMELRRHISALQYVPSVYADADAFSTIPLSFGETAGNVPTVQLLGAKALPDLAGPVLAVEESHEDPDTGHLSKALAVSWRHDRATAQHVARTYVWLEKVGLDGSPELVGTVQGRGTFFRIEGTGRRLARGGSFRVYVQPETVAGVKRGVRRCRSVQVTLNAYFPVPREAPVAARLVGAGDQVVYEVDLPARFQGKAVEFWRGGAFIGAEIGRIPVGGRTLGPTYDWVAPPTAADGRGAAPLMVRLVSPHGARGDFLRVRSAHVPAGFADPPDLAASLEDGPFDTAPAGFTVAPVLSNLQLVAPAPGSSVQRLAFLGGGAAASYTSTVFDLGTARRVHVGICWEGLQVAPPAVGDLPSVEDPSMRSWTPEGFTDPNHAGFGAVACALQWTFSTTSADPGSDYRPFRPGVAYVRSCRFRLAFTRPTADWDMRLDRIAVDIRSMLDDQGAGGGLQTAGVLFGNAVDTVYVLTHGAGSRDLPWSILQAASPFAVVDATVEATTPDTVTVRLAAPPGDNALRFVPLAQPSDKAIVPFGDTVATSYTVEHGLGSRQLLCAVRELASPFAFVSATLAASTPDSIGVSVSSPPGNSALALIAVAGALGKVAVIFGDAIATSYVIHHGLGSRDIVARVRSTGTPWDYVACTIEATDDDTVTVTLAAPPGLNALTFIAVG